MTRALALILALSVIVYAGGFVGVGTAMDERTDCRRLSCRGPSFVAAATWPIWISVRLLYLAVKP